MRAAVRVLSVLLASAVVAVGAMSSAGASASASGGTKADRDRSYAKTLCSTLTGLHDTEAQLVTAYDALDRSRPATFQRDARRLIAGYLSRLESAEARLAKVRPNGGRKVAKAFDDYLDAATKALRSLREDFGKADPLAKGFQADVATFEAGLQSLSRVVPDPFPKVADQHLVAAFRDEPSCASVVRVT